MLCPICGKKLEFITPAHAKKHGYSMQEWRDKYGNNGRQFKYGKAELDEVDKYLQGKGKMR
jgi:hypothetical protein